MDIESTLRRRVEECRKKHGRYPGRILLKGEKVKMMADVMVKRQQMLGMDHPPFGEKTPDEKFLDGGMATFKGIPLIAEIKPEDELIVE
jgi:hypothetical protein